MSEEKARGASGGAVRWLTVDSAEIGMVLARPVVASQQGVLSLTVAAGAVLTGDLLIQLMVQGVTCVGLEDEEDRDPDALRMQRECHRRRLEEIFGCCREKLDPGRQALFDALLAGGTQ